MENSSKTIVRRYLEEVVSTGNLERVSDFVAPADVEAAIDHIRAIRTTYPDLQVTIRMQIAEGDLVATRLVATGTHRGAFFGIEPTNKSIRIDAVNIDRIKDGKIVEHWGAANTLEALLEIGALPAGRER
jgi:predicted ester cyclase